MKYWALRQLADFFQWLEKKSGDWYNATNYCEACGKPKWSSPPCVKFDSEGEEL